MKNKNCSLSNDCRHFRGDRPCVPHKNTGVHCKECTEYDPIKTRILVIKLDATGDVLRTAGIVPSLQAKYPSVHITWITEPDTVPLLELVPGIDQIWPNDGQLWSKLLTEKFDLTFGLDCSKNCAALAFLSKADKKISFSLDEAGQLQPLSPAAGKWFQMGLWDNLKRANRRTYQEILWEICELPPPVNPPVITIPEHLKSEAEEFASRTEISRNGPVIGLFTGAGQRWPQKSLTLSKQKMLLHKLAEKCSHSSIIVFGGPGEEQQNTALLKNSLPNVINAGCRNPLPKFASLVNLVDILITPDTLALHVGLALRKQIIAYFGPTSPWEVDLFGFGEKIIAPVDCIACYQTDCALSPNCSDLLSVDTILDTVDRMMKVYEPA
jgi:heptosyltransferase-2